PQIKIYADHVSGIVDVSENSQFNDISADSITVRPNITARLFGTVKDLFLKKHAKVYLHGEILGNVKNDGGEIHIFDPSAPKKGFLET
ncbi:MAG TPA: hypothetical protein VGF30_10500, partial [Bacteroidia bacterium]